MEVALVVGCQILSSRCQILGFGGHIADTRFQILDYIGKIQYTRFEIPSYRGQIPDNVPDTDTSCQTLGAK